MKDKNIIGLLAGIILGILLGVGYLSISADAKVIKEYKGKFFISSYSASDNTPRGTHQTSSGAYATPGITAAVDMSNPIAGMGQTVEIEGLGKRVIQDVGNFGYCNGGMRALDIFTEEGQGFLLCRKVWVYREETEEEIARRKRDAKERQRSIRKQKQLCSFNLVFNPCLSPWQIITDPDIIPGGTAIAEWGPFEWQHLDVVATKRGLGRCIEIGDRQKVLNFESVKFAKVIEEAVG